MNDESCLGLVTVHKRERTSSKEEYEKSPVSAAKKRKFKIVANDSQTSVESSSNSSTPSKIDIEPSAPQSLKELMALVCIIDLDLDSGLMNE